MKQTVLIIEDDRYIGELIEFNLLKSGYNAIRTDNANDGLIFLNQHNVDLILLDLMLPGLQGEEFLEFIKAKSGIENIPIMIVTAKTDENLFVKLLDSGADDFLIKPFGIKVLLAKTAALLRRSTANKLNILEMDGIKINRDEHGVSVENKNIELTKTEFDLLELFLSNPNKVFSREYLLSSIWGDDDSISDRTVDVHISNLRKKLGKKSKNIKSIPKVGYKFSV